MRSHGTGDLLGRISNSWSPSIQVSAAYHGPDSDRVYKRHTATLSASSFRPSEDGLSVQCENISVKFDAAKQSYKVTLNAAPALVVDLDFTAVDGFCQVDEGKVPFKKSDISVGYVSAQFIPKARVTGHVIVDGKLHDAAGTGLFVKALQSKPQCVARWNFVNFQTEKDTLLMYQVGSLHTQSSLPSLTCPPSVRARAGLRI